MRFYLREVLFFLLNIRIITSSDIFHEVTQAMNVLVRAYFRSKSIIIVKCHYGELSNSPIIFGDVYDLHVKTDTPVYLYDCLTFLNGINGMSSFNFVTDNADIVFMVDTLEKSVQLSQVQFDAETQLILLIMEQKHKVISKTNPNFLIIEVLSTKMNIHSLKIEQLCVLQSNVSVVVKRSKMKPFKPKIDVKEWGSRMFINTCSVTTAFILNEMVQENTEFQLDFVKKHFVYKLFRCVGKIMNFQPNIGIYQFEKKAVFEVQNSGALSLVYYSSHWMIGKYFTTGVRCSKSLIFMGMEDIVWLLVNQKTYTQNAIFMVFIFFFSIILVAILLTIEKLIVKSSGTLGILSTLLLSWSILLSVGIPQQPSKKLFRIFFFAWTLISAVLTLCFYNKVLSSMMAIDDFKIHSQDDLLASDIPMLVFSEEYADIAFSSLDRNKIRPYESYFGHHGQDIKKNISFFKLCNELLENGKTFAILMDYSLSRNILEESKINDKSYYYIPEVVTSYPVMIKPSFSNNFTIGLVNTVKRLEEAGIVQHIMDSSNRFRRYSLSKYLLNLALIREEDDDNNDDNGYMFYVFVLAAMLYGISILVFIFELIYFRISKK